MRWWAEKKRVRYSPLMGRLHGDCSAAGLWWSFKGEVTVEQVCKEVIPSVWRSCGWRISCSIWSKAIIRL